METVPEAIFSAPSPNVLADIVRRVQSVASPRRIVLFGSAATGEMNADSDVDLLVTLETVENPRRESVKISRALRGLGRPIDIIVISDSRFEESKDVVGGIAYPANKYGRLIYEEPGRSTAGDRRTVEVEG